jgi:hypothetical protein
VRQVLWKRRLGRPPQSEGRSWPVNDEVEYLCDATDLGKREALVGTTATGMVCLGVAGTTITALAQDSSHIEAWRVQSGVSQPDNGTGGFCTVQDEELASLQNG